MNRMIFVSACAALVALSALACGGGGGASTPTAAPSAAETVQPTPNATEQRQGVEVQTLRSYVLLDTDVGGGYRVGRSAPSNRKDTATAQIGIPSLATYISKSDLWGVWGKLFIGDQKALSSVLYLFQTPQSAGGLVSALAALKDADYPAATSVERAPADKIGDASQMMRYKIPGATTLEYTWAQGRLAGQVIIRYVGDTEAPDDAALIVVLARKQFERMSRYPQ